MAREELKIEAAILRRLYDMGEQEVYFDCLSILRDNSKKRVSLIKEAQLNTTKEPAQEKQVSQKPVSNQRTVRKFDESLLMPRKTSNLDFKLPSIDVQDKAEYFNEYRQKIQDCMNCRLGSTRTNFVFGDGNPDADIMFIGEAPGKDEDLSGYPFVGRAGKLLDKILSAMTLNRTDVFIGNIIKCRPPNNRDPKDDEVEQCYGYLLHQIAVIQPKIIVFLGRISAQTLLQTKKPMRELRKSTHEFAGIPAVVTYHPAALLRNPAFKRPTWEDMKVVMRYAGIGELGLNDADNSSNS